RPYWAAGHLINTFILLAFLALTAWFASGERQKASAIPTKAWVLLAAGVAAIFVTGVSGSMAALTNMLFPSATLSEGIAKDFAPDSHILLRLRIFHPIISIFTAMFLFMISAYVKKMVDREGPAAKWAGGVSALVLAQIAFGAATLLMLAPIVMQLGHLILADLVWIAFVLMWASLIWGKRPVTGQNALP